MRSFYTLLSLTSDPEIMTVTKFDASDFNTTVIWEGKPCLNGMPPSVRLFVDLAGTKSSDYLWNWLSWPILSQRFVDIVSPLIRNDVELLPAPLYDSKSGESCHGYCIVNLLRTVACLAPEQSVLAISEDDGSLMGVYEYAFHERNIPVNFHIFRPAEWIHAIVVSQEFVECCTGRGLKGLGFTKAKTI